MLEREVKRALRCRFCPFPLLSFLRRARGIGGDLKDSEYQELLEILEPNDLALEHFVHTYFAARDEQLLKRGLWPHAG